MRILSLGDRLERGHHALLARHERAANYGGPAGLLSVVTREVGAGPVNVVVTGGSVPEADSVRVGDGAVWIGGRRFGREAARVYVSDVRAPGIDAREPLALAGLDVLENVLRDEAPSRSMAFLLDAGRIGEFRTPFELRLARRLAAGARALCSGDVVSGARRLRGCGFGLTPSGDDFLCGVMTGLNAMDARGGGRFGASIREINTAAEGGDVMVRTFRDLAAAGRAHSSVRSLIRALERGDGEAIVEATRRLLAHGATSGADLAVGLALVLRFAPGWGARERPRVSFDGADTGDAAWSS